MSDMNADRERFRRACWRMLEPDLDAFWEDFRKRSGFDARDLYGKLISIEGARTVVSLVIEYRRNEIADLQEPARTQATAVLQECVALIDEFFAALVRGI